MQKQRENNLFKIGRIIGILAHFFTF